MLEDDIVILLPLWTYKLRLRSKGICLSPHCQLVIIGLLVQRYFLHIMLSLPLH